MSSRQLERTAFVIPGTTDMNRGDQALLWLTEDFILSSGLAKRIVSPAPDEGPIIQARQTSQSEDRGIGICPPLIRHPRRGRPETDIRLSGLHRLREYICAVTDFVRHLIWLAFGCSPRLSRLLFGSGVEAATRQLRAASVLVAKGGGFIHAGASVQSLYYLWYQMMPFLAAQRLGIPAFIMPNSVGPIQSSFGRALVRFSLRRARIFAREQRSCDYLEDVLGLHASWAADLAFGVSGDASSGRKVLSSLGVPADCSLVGFTARPYRFPEVESVERARRHESYMSALEHAARHLHRLGHYLVLVVHVSGPSRHEDDRIAIGELSSRIAELPHSVIETQGTYQEIANVYAALDGLIATRLHSAIFALASETPTVAIAYGGFKASGVFEGIGIPHAAARIEDCDTANLADMLIMEMQCGQSRRELVEEYLRLAEESWRALRAEMENLATRL